MEVVEGRSLTIRVRLQGCPPRDGNDPPASYAFLLAGVDPISGRLFFISERTFLVLKVPRSRKQHHQPHAVNGFDHFGVAHAAAGLHDGGNAIFCRGFNAVGKWEEGI